MITEHLKMTGALTVEKNGEVVHRINNLVVTAGKNLVASRLAGAGSSVTHMAVGSGTLRFNLGCWHWNRRVNRSGFIYRIFFGNNVSPNCVFCSE